MWEGGLIFRRICSSTKPAHKLKAAEKELKKYIGEKIDTFSFSIVCRTFPGVLKVLRKFVLKIPIN